MSDIYTRNCTQDLYLVDPEDNRIIFIPKDWCDEFRDDDEYDPDAGPTSYCWIGQPSVTHWELHPDKQFFTYDTQGWMPVQDLEQMREVTPAEARQIDPDLFRLLNAVNTGVAT